MAEILDRDESKAAPIAEDTDFFTLGLDSLGAYRVFSRIVKTLDLGPRASEVAGNVCFEYPNVAALASYLSALRSGGSFTKRGELDEMQALIDRYGALSPQRVTDAGAPRVVLLTGATGSLGAHILAELLRAPGIEKILLPEPRLGSAGTYPRVAEAARPGRRAGAARRARRVAEHRSDQARLRRSLRGSSPASTSSSTTPGASTSTWESPRSRRRSRALAT